MKKGDKFTCKRAKRNVWDILEEREGGNDVLYSQNKRYNFKKIKKVSHELYIGLLSVCVQNKKGMFLYCSLIPEVKDHWKKGLCPSENIDSVVSHLLCKKRKRDRKPLCFVYKLTPKAHVLRVGL